MAEQGGQPADADKTEEFVRIFSQHATRLRAYIIAIVLDPTDADEVFQNTSCLLWQKFATFDPKTNFMAWACRVAYLEFNNYRRIKGRRPILSDEVVRLAAAEAESTLEQSELRHESLHECLDDLSEPDRRMLRFRYYEQRAVQEIADLLRTSVHTVYRRLNRVYDLLLACIERRIAMKEANR